MLQNLCYVRAGLPIVIEAKYFSSYCFSSYLPGTKPEKFVDAPEIDTIKSLFITSVDRLRADYAKIRAGNYSPASMSVRCTAWK